MNKKANIFRSFIIFCLILLAIAVMVIISPTADTLITGASDQAGLTGVEELFFENWPLVVILLGTGALLLLASTGGG